MVFIAAMASLLTSFQASFHNYWTSSFILGYIFDVLFLVDVFLKTHTAYLQGGFWVVFPKEMLYQYVSTRQFKFDVVANFPYDIFVLFAYVSPTRIEVPVLLTLVRLPKLMRTASVIMYFHSQEKKLYASFSIQIVKFLTYLVILTHTISCVWFSLACPYGATTCFERSWVSLLAEANGAAGERSYDVWSLYVASVYWTVTSMTTTGYGDIRPVNNLERSYSFIVQTIGVFFFGYVSGTIASTLSNMDSRRVSYQQKMDAIRQYMITREMEPEMQERVVDYYDYVWERNRGIDVKNLFEDMPITFKSEVALSLNNQIIDKAAIFHNCSIGFRRRIAIVMRLYLFTANEFIVHKGDLGIEMYFITQGRIDVYANDDSKKATGSLIEGGHFGEYGVVLGHRHEKSAKAICNTDIYVLTRDDLNAAFLAFPDDKERVITATKEEWRKYREMARRRSLIEKSHDISDDDDHDSPSIVSDLFDSIQSPPVGEGDDMVYLGKKMEGLYERKLSLLPNFSANELNEQPGDSISSDGPMFRSVKLSNSNIHRSGSNSSSPSRQLSGGGAPSPTRASPTRPNNTSTPASPSSSRSRTIQSPSTRRPGKQRSTRQPIASMEELNSMRMAHFSKPYTFEEEKSGDDAV
ncbi:MAG: hypothetical protein SGCHY_001360 [Lobulomycetales sp.]